MSGYKPWPQATQVEAATGRKLQEPLKPRTVQVALPLDTDTDIYTDIYTDTDTCTDTYTDTEGADASTGEAGSCGGVLYFPAKVSIHPSIHQSIKWHLSVCQSVHPSICPSISPSILQLSIRLSIHPSIHPQRRHLLHVLHLAINPGAEPALLRQPPRLSNQICTVLRLANILIRIASNSDKILYLWCI